MSRQGALLVTVAGLCGCNALIVNFEDGDSGITADATIEAGAPSDSADAATDAGMPPSADGTIVANAADAAPDATSGDENRDAIADTGPSDGDEPSVSLGQCHNESDCARLGLHCALTDASTGSCVPCVSSADCLDLAYSRCDLTLNRCVECDVPADCRVGEVCLADVTHTCIPSCVTLPCPPRAGYCDPTRNVCLGCRDDAECPVGEACDTVSGQCGECAADTDCHRKPFLKCDRTTSHCVECFRNSDCGKGVCTASGLCLGGSEPGDARGDE